MYFKGYSPKYRAMLLMSEVSKVRTGPSIQSNVTHGCGVKSAYMAPQYRVILLMSKVSKVVFVAVYRLILLMLEVSKVDSFICQRCRKRLKIHNKGCNAMYVKGVKRSSIYTVRAVMLCMCHGFVSAGDALGQERPATPMLSFLAGRSGCK